MLDDLLDKITVSGWFSLSVISLLLITFLLVRSKVPLYKFFVIMVAIIAIDYCSYQRTITAITQVLDDEDKTCLVYKENPVQV